MTKMSWNSGLNSSTTIQRTKASTRTTRSRARRLSSITVPTTRSWTPTTIRSSTRMSTTTDHLALSRRATTTIGILSRTNTPTKRTLSGTVAETTRRTTLLIRGYTITIRMPNLEQGSQKEASSTISENIRDIRQQPLPAPGSAIITSKITAQCHTTITFWITSIRFRKWCHHSKGTDRHTSSRQCHRTWPSFRRRCRWRRHIRPRVNSWKRCLDSFTTSPRSPSCLPTRKFPNSSQAKDFRIFRFRWLRTRRWMRMAMRMRNLTGPPKYFSQIRIKSYSSTRISSILKWMAFSWGSLNSRWTLWSRTTWSSLDSMTHLRCLAQW